VATEPFEGRSSRTGCPSDLVDLYGVHG
jgi:hypothetical protein